jgi:fucose permease
MQTNKMKMNEGDEGWQIVEDVEEQEQEHHEQDSPLTYSTFSMGTSCSTLLGEHIIDKEDEEERKSTTMEDNDIQDNDTQENNTQLGMQDGVIWKVAFVVAVLILIILAIFVALLHKENMDLLAQQKQLQQEVEYKINLYQQYQA